MLLAEKGCNTVAEGFLRRCLSNTIKIVCLIKDSISAEINTRIYDYLHKECCRRSGISFCTMMP